MSERINSKKKKPYNKQQHGVSLQSIDHKQTNPQYKKTLDKRIINITITQMSKPAQQVKQPLKRIIQVHKQKPCIYPYYPVSCKYQDNNQLLIFSVEYPNGVACITFFMINRNTLYSKDGSMNIQLAGINDKSAIAVVQVIDFKYKEMTSSLWPLQGVVLIGYRSGELVITNFKQRKTHVTHRFNKLIRKQSFMQKTSNFFYSEQGYKTLIKGPIKHAMYNSRRRFLISYLVGNTFVMLKQKDQKAQQLLQKQYKRISDDVSIKRIKIVMNEGVIYTVKGVQICGYTYSEREQVFLAFSMQSIVSCFSTKDMSLLYSISMTMPIRKINQFTFNNQVDYLTILPYEDYAILINLRQKQYVKLIGHKCFIANMAMYQNDNNELMIVSGGLDHKVCFDKMVDIKPWSGMMVDNEKKKLEMGQWDGLVSGMKNYVIDEDKNGVEFYNRFTLGQYSNARTNLHDYGFSELIQSQNICTFPTYDGKIKVFSINYK